MATAGTCRRASRFILVGILPVLLVAAFAAAPQMERRTVYVTALDRDGKPVPGLTAADFRIKEDGRIREVARVEVAIQPMQIALLLDDGGPSLGATRQAAGQFVERLQGKSTFSLITTGGQPKTRVSFTEDPRVLYGALQNLFANPAPTTQFLDSLVEVARNFVRRKAQRPVIVAIIAEGEELSDVRADVVMQAVQQSRAVFYYIGLGVPVIIRDATAAPGEPARGLDRTRVDPAKRRHRCRAEELRGTQRAGAPTIRSPADDGTIRGRIERRTVRRDVLHQQRPGKTRSRHAPAGRQAARSGAGWGQVGATSGHPQEGPRRLRGAGRYLWLAHSRRTGGTPG